VEERWNRLKTKLTEAALDPRTTQGKRNTCLTPLFNEEIREYRNLEKSVFKIFTNIKGEDYEEYKMGRKKEIIATRKSKQAIF
jgi:hypothetical protein